MRWPWQRERPAPPTSGNDVATTAHEPGASREPAPSPMGWAFLPPLQRTIAPAALVSRPHEFPSSLPAWRNPSFSSPELSHLVSPAAPSGVIDGDGTGAPVQRSAATDLTLLLPAPPKAPHPVGPAPSVQTDAVPEVAAAPDAPSDDHVVTGTTSAPSLPTPELPSRPAPVQRSVQHSAPPVTASASTGIEERAASASVVPAGLRPTATVTSLPMALPAAVPTRGYTRTSTDALPVLQLAAIAEPIPVPTGTPDAPTSSDAATAPEPDPTPAPQSAPESAPESAPVSGSEPGSVSGPEPGDATSEGARSEPTRPTLGTGAAVQRSVDDAAAAPVRSTPRRVGLGAPLPSSPAHGSTDVPPVPVQRATGAAAMPVARSADRGTAAAPLGGPPPTPHLPDPPSLPGRPGQEHRVEPSPDAGTERLPVEIPDARVDAGSDQVDQVVQRSVLPEPPRDLPHADLPVAALPPSPPSSDAPHAPEPGLPEMVADDPASGAQEAPTPEASTAESSTADAPTLDRADPVTTATSPAEPGSSSHDTSAPAATPPPAALAMAVQRSTEGGPITRGAAPHRSVPILSRAAATGAAPAALAAPNGWGSPSGRSLLGVQRGVTVLDEPASPAPTAPTPVGAVGYTPLVARSVAGTSAPTLTPSPSPPPALSPSSSPLTPTWPMAPALQRAVQIDELTIRSSPNYGRPLPTPPSRPSPATPASPALPLAPDGPEVQAPDPATSSPSREATFTPPQPVVDPRSSGATEVPIGGGGGQAPSGATDGAPAAVGGAAGGATSPQEVEALAEKLFPPMLRRFRAEMLIDRERRGHRTDTWSTR